jgi:hypothetical protein
MPVCLPPWTERKLRHKLAEIRRVSHLRATGYLQADSKKRALTPARILGRITLPELPTAAEDKKPAANLAERHCVGQADRLSSASS